jgi:hypothetical protein
MAHSNNLLKDRTLRLWQPRSSRLLSGEDLRQIIENTTGFFLALLEWDANNPESHSSISSIATPRHRFEKQAPTTRRRVM